MQFANDVQEGTLNTKTTPCSHGFKIYRPGQTDRLTELIYKIGSKRPRVMCFGYQLTPKKLITNAKISFRTFDIHISKLVVIE